MAPKYNVLIVDDHPLISEAYESSLMHLSSIIQPFEFKIEIANNCESAYEKIKTASKRNGIDLVILDIRLPPYKIENILSGEDLGIKIIKLLPKSKIIISTTLNDNYRILGILRSINPDGFLIKNDITNEELRMAFQTVIKGAPYYSKTINKLLRKNICNDKLLDKIDRILLYELSIGTKMKDLPNILPLSIAGIEKRKRNLKEIFNVKIQDDRTLILIAKEKGFI